MGLQLPRTGKPRSTVLAEMERTRERDVQWRSGKVFSLVFSAGEEVAAVVREAYVLFMSENGLNPSAFPSLRQFETEVIAMSAQLLGGDATTAGNMTSGGTESILLAVKTARDWARAHHPDRHPPEMVLPVTAHPAFDKAAAYFDVVPVRIPVDAGFRADVSAAAAAVTPRTILMVGSAPAYPHGVVDPIRDLAAIARRHETLFHVDACVGGFMLPFVRQLGYPVPDFDFRVPGVTSISADLHKYGYGAKGSSLILYRDRALRRFQMHAYTEWPGGIYASPTMAGTRPGGAIAAAWAVLNHLGEEGYLALAEAVMTSVARVRVGIAASPYLHILGEPDMSVMALASDRLDIYEVGDELAARGWHLDRQHYPPSLHLTINYQHVGMEEVFLADLAASVERVRHPGLRRRAVRLALGAGRAGARALPEAWLSRLTRRAGTLLGSSDGLPARSAPMYGMIGALPNRGDVRELVLDLVSGFTEPQSNAGP